MNKFYILILALANFIAAKYDSLPVCRKNDTAFVFDFHGVIAKVKPGKAIKGFATNKRKGRFVKRLFKWEKGLSIEAAFLDRNDNVLGDDIKTLNPFVIDEKVISIARNLKEKGYAVFLCSDIGEKMFEYFKNKRPDLFGENGLFYCCWTSSKANGYVDKKNPKAFELCKKMIKDWASKNNRIFTNFVMIDDTTAKLDAASQAGFKCYKFKKSKKLNCAISQALTI